MGRSTSTGRRLAADLLTADEVRRLIHASSGRCPTGIRNRALIAVLYRTGIRIGELLAMVPSDLDEEQGTLNVRRGKGNTQRWVAMDEGGWAVLQRWMDHRRRLGFGARQPIFCTLRGRPLWRSYVDSALPRLARRAGILKRVHPHGLRHCFSVEMDREGVSLTAISLALGHKSAATTAIYLRRLSPKEAHQAVRKRRWSAEEAAPVAHE